MLPQFGMTEFLLIAVIALIVVGPKDLPMMMRKLGQFVSKGRSMAREFQSAFDDIARQAELDELRKEIEDLRRDNQLTQAVDDLKKTEADINRKVMMENPLPDSDADSRGPGAMPETEETEQAASPDEAEAPASPAETEKAGDAAPDDTGKKASST